MYIHTRRVTCADACTHDIDAFGDALFLLLMHLLLHSNRFIIDINHLPNDGGSGGGT